MIQSKLFSIGILMVLASFIVSQIGYYHANITLLMYLSYGSMLFGIFILFFVMFRDLTQDGKFKILSYTISLVGTLSIVGLYFFQRKILHRFDFFIADASDYYLAGVNAVLNGGDQGFFLPLTSAISAVGFSIFSYELGPLIIVIVYSLVIPLSYFIYRAFKLNRFLSFIMVVLTISVPVSIWFTKSTYSESIWQIELLVLMVLSYKILQEEKFRIVDFISFVFLMILVPFTRGEASLLYGFIIFLSFYHLWKYQNIKISLILASSSIFLAMAIEYTIGLREHYLLKWQYARIIPDITESQLMTLLYSVSFVILLLLFLFSLLKTKVTSIKLPLVITFLAIVFKVAVAYIYNIKKTVAIHTLLFKNALGFTNFLIMNELGFSYQNFGLIITGLIVIGLILLHIKAMQGDFLALAAVVVYAIFALPFVMQCVNSNDIHEIFMYWGRYYFSIIMIIHLFGLALVLKLLSASFEKFISNKIYINILILATVSLIVYFSMDSKIYTIVTKEGYFSNSQKLMPWLKKYVKNNTVSVIYDKDIKYELHHNREYDLRILTYRTFPIEKINVKDYQKVKSKALNPSLIKDGLTKSQYILCLANKECNLANKSVVYVDTLKLPISWREHYGIHKTNKQVLAGELSQSTKHEFVLYATLYKVYKEEKERIVNFRSRSKQNIVVLKNGWYGIVAGNGALTNDIKSSMIIKNIQKNKNKRYTLTLQYIIMNASKKKPKTLRFRINGETISEHLVDSRFNDYVINVPNRLLPSKTDALNLEIERIDGKERKLKIILESIKIEEK